jgi:GNAT superfamily N-acetyltransferase
MTLTFKPATRDDVPKILDYIKALAAYEKLSDAVVADEAILEKTLFETPYAHVFFAMMGEEDVGFAVYFFNYSTFLGRPGLYVEDVYVKPEHRHQGIGKAIFQELARIAEKHHCGRMQWWCLNWNQPSIDFYLKLGAQPQQDWTVFKLSEAEIRALSKTK